MFARALVIEHAVIVSPERSTPLRDATVYIENGQIFAISAGSERRIPKAFEHDPAIIDAAGLYLTLD